MKFPSSYIFTAYSEYLDWLRDVVDYISAYCTHSALWPLIKEVAQEETAKYEARGPRVMVPRPFALPEAGYVSNLFFVSLTFKRGKGKGADGGIPGGVVDRAFALLAEKGMLFEQPTASSSPYFPEKEYTVNAALVKYLVDHDLVYNHLFGFNYIIERYSNSVVKIEVRQGEEISIGTGWFFDLLFNTPEMAPLRLVVTNDHVLENHSSFRILTNDETVLAHGETELLMGKTGVDMALIKLVDSLPTPDFYLSFDVPLLEEVITIGYPSVPMSREAYQVVHRGEVNARVTDMWSQELLIISARTAPGNSGSPVIDDTGRVVGMVARELFEKSAFQEKGITPYSACIPAKIIQKTLEQSAIYQNWFAAHQQPTEQGE